MNLNPGFQVSLNIQGRLCLVIGGDEEAVDKVERLLDAGAKVTVINPTLHKTLRTLTASGKIIHRGRTFRALDTQGVAVVVNTLRQDRTLATSLYDLAQTERFLVWTLDQPDVSTIMMPALVRRGHLRIAISTSGASPGLAKLLRQEHEQLFQEEFVQFLDWLAKLRKEIRESEPSQVERREHLKEALDGFRLTGSMNFPKRWLMEKEQRRAKETEIKREE